MKNLICLLVLLLMFSCTGKQANVEKNEVEPYYSVDNINRTVAAVDSACAVLDSSFTLELTKKENIKDEGRKFLYFTFDVKNKGDKEIKAVKGKLMFCDLFDEYIKVYDILYDKKVLLPGDSLSYIVAAEVTIPGPDEVVMSKSLNSLKVTWKTMNILYEDGTQLDKDRISNHVTDSLRQYMGDGESEL